MARRKASSSLKTVTAVAAAVIGGIFLFNRFKNKTPSSHFVGRGTPPGGDYSFTRRPGFNSKEY